MASLTLLQLKEQVRDLMRDNANTSLIEGTGDDANSYSDAQVKDAINYAIRIFSERTNASFTETSLTVDVNGLASLPEDCIKIEDVLFAHKTLTETLASLEDMKNPEWEIATGNYCKRWARWSGNKLKLTPIAWASSTVCTLGYIASPTVLSLDTDTVDARIPEYEQGYLKYAAAWYLLQMLNDQANQALADKYMKTFNSMISETRS